MILNVTRHIELDFAVDSTLLTAILRGDLVVRHGSHQSVVFTDQSPSIFLYVFNIKYQLN